MGKVKKYVPQAGDICIWHNPFYGDIVIVIVSPKFKTSTGRFGYLCAEIERPNEIWVCNSQYLTLIHRP
jgi:hypothetical protein